MERAPWIIGGSIVLAAVIVAVALFGLQKEDDTLATNQRPAVAEAPLIEAQQEAQDRLAQSILRNAIAAADVYFTDGDTYAGWSPDVAGQIEPSLIWIDDVPASPDIVTINLATTEEVVMSTMSKSGQALCIAKDVSLTGGQYSGNVDAYGATGASACTGGW